MIKRESAFRNAAEAHASGTAAACATAAASSHSDSSEDTSTSSLSSAPSIPSFCVHDAPELGSSGTSLSPDFEVKYTPGQRFRILKHKTVPHMKAKEDVMDLFKQYESKVAAMVAQGQATLPSGTTLQQWIQEEKAHLAKLVDILCFCC